MLKHNLLIDLSTLDPSKLWRLFIDCDRQNIVGPMGFDEKEPNYLKGLFHGFEVLLQNLNLPLTAEFIRDLHDQTIEEVTSIYHYFEAGTEDPKCKEESFQKNFRDSATSFGIVTSGEGVNVNKAGLLAFLRKIQNGSIKANIKNENFLPIAGLKLLSMDTLKDINLDNSIDDIWDAINASNCLVALEKTSGSKLEVLINEKITTYLNNIENANNNDEKLHVIATFIQDLEQTHPFEDANCRTLCILLLNKLLLENGFGLTAITNPNKFDLYSVDDLVDEIKNGIIFVETQLTQLEDSFHKQTLLYLKDNPFLSTIVATHMLSNCNHWNEINREDKKKVTELLVNFLQTVKTDAFTGEDFDNLKVQCIAEVNKSIYQKTNFPFFTSSPHEYRIHFSDSIFAFILITNQFSGKTNR